MINFFKIKYYLVLSSWSFLGTIVKYCCVQNYNIFQYNDWSFSFAYNCISHTCGFWRWTLGKLFFVMWCKVLLLNVNWNYMEIYVLLAYTMLSMVYRCDCFLLYFDDSLQISFTICLSTLVCKCLLNFFWTSNINLIWSR